MRISGNTAFRFLEWDSAHFGLRIGRVFSPHFDAELSREALAWAQSLSVDCMYLLVDAADARSVRAAAECGWRVVDMRVTLSTAAADDGGGSGCIRLATPADIPELKDIAARSHRDSRFYADGNFPAAACDALFETWIERSVREREFAGVVLVAELNSRAAGYITCSVCDHEGQIGLVAVHEAARGAGLGTHLVAESVRWSARHGAEKIMVVTQGCNVAALRMYERRGFRTASVQLWFHWWRGGPCGGPRT